MSLGFVSDVESKAEFDNYLADTSLVLVVQFWTKWCQDYENMDKLFLRLSTIFHHHHHARFLRVEAEEQFQISKAYGIYFLPQFIIFKNGKVFDTAKGVCSYDLAARVAEAIDPSFLETITEISNEYILNLDALLLKNLQPLIDSHPIMLFMEGNPQNPKSYHSQTLVDILKGENLQFGTFDILLDDKVREDLRKLHQTAPLPQLYFNGELLGGCYEIIEMHETRRLKEVFKDHHPIPNLVHEAPAVETVEEPKSGELDKLLANYESQLYSSYEEELGGGEEEDKPIYLLCEGYRDQLYSYVIEEGNQKQNCLIDDDRPQTRRMTDVKTKLTCYNPDVLYFLNTHPNTIVERKQKRKLGYLGLGHFYIDDDYDLPVMKGNFTVVSQTKSESSGHHQYPTIRALTLPSCSFQVSCTQLFVFNSLFYLFCGRHLPFDRHLELNKTIFFDILNPTKGWEAVSSNLSHSQSFFKSATTSNNGSIVVLFGKPSPRALFRKSINSTWKELPKPPGYLRFNYAKVIAFTDTDIYWTIPSIISRTLYGSGPSYGVRFNLAKWEWYVFDRNNSFQGDWSQGVVFYDSYLFFAGTRKQTAFLRVYDLKACQWLPKEHPFPPSDHNYRDAEPVDPQLFQISHNKLAIIWTEAVRCFLHEPLFPVYCTKYKIHKTNGDQPQVSATVISHGLYLVDGLLISSAVGISVGEEDERGDEQCPEIVQQDEVMIPAYG